MVVIIRFYQIVGVLFVFGEILFCDTVFVILHPLQHLRVHPFTVVVCVLVVIEVAFGVGVGAV